MIRRPAIWLALSLAVLPTAPALAQAANASAEAVADPFAGLVQAINSGVDEDVMFARLLSQMRDALIAGDPNSAALEREYPGVISAMVEAMAPGLRRHSQRLNGEMNRRMAALFGSSLTADEARDAAAFYRSPLGRRLLASVQENHTSNALVREAVAEGASGEVAISRDAVAADMAAGGRAAIRDLSADDMAQMARMAATASWLAKVNALQPQIIAIRTTMENAAMTPKDDMEMQEAAVDAVARFMADGAKSKGGD